MYNILYDTAYIRETKEGSMSSENYIDALMQKLSALKEDINKDRQHIKELLEKVQAKEEQANYIVKLLEAEDVSLSGKVVDGLQQKSISDLAFEKLKSFQQEPVHYRKLADLIISDGKLIPGQDPAANLISHLSRDSRFVRVGRGTYGLAEWGLEPAKKTTSRKRKSSKRR